MSKIKIALLVILLATMVLAVLINDSTAAWFSSSDDFAVVFTAGNDFGTSTLQENLDLIINDLVENGRLNSANITFNPRDSWSRIITDAVSGGSNQSNVYDFENPISYSKQVVRSEDLVDKNQWNPMLFITNNSAFSYDRISDYSNLNHLFGSLIIYKPNGNHPLEYYYVGENGELGEINTLSF